MQQGSVVSSVGALFIPAAAAALGQPPPPTGDGEMMLRAALRAALAWRCAVSACGAEAFVVMVLVKFLRGLNVSAIRCGRALAVPRLGKPRPWPGLCSLDWVGEVVAHTAQQAPPPTPTPSGGGWAEHHPTHPHPLPRPSPSRLRLRVWSGPQNASRKPKLHSPGCCTASAASAGPSAAASAARRPSLDSPAGDLGQMDWLDRLGEQYPAPGSGGSGDE